MSQSCPRPHKQTNNTTMSFLAGIANFNKDELKPTETVVRHLPIYGIDQKPLGYGIEDEDDRTEFEDDEDTLTAKIEELIGMVLESKKIVFFTGAGISTAANIPDFRGPETGVCKNEKKKVCLGIPR
eukprot:TRINITY_DN3478_c0_g1_i1.p2 TRINITY_DN3478_c0_g1~~TRINITY_DN3478_c0_g1_i1.p2  ORF type:complete len:127 (+),score=33.97 TRINITY_DN3478_c0_g1_i1:91-471(+)